MAEYEAIVTKLGLAKIANSIHLGEKLKLEKFAVGDGGGRKPDITNETTSLANEMYRGEITKIEKQSADTIEITGLIPFDVGGFYVRELGIYDEDGDLIIVTQYPSFFKPSIEHGSTSEEEFALLVKVSNANLIEMVSNPHLISATKNDLDELKKELINLIENSEISEEEWEFIKRELDKKANKTDLNKKANKEDIPTQVSQLNNDKGYMTKNELPSIQIPVKSVNNKTGNVVLDANDINYDRNYTVKRELDLKAYNWDLIDKADKSDIPTRVGQLYNDKGYITKADVPDVDFPVSSVNGMTGRVVLDGDNIKANRWRTINEELDRKLENKDIEGKANKEDISRTSTIVIANYDSHENSKKGADIVIEKGENAAVKINEAIQSLEGIGGEVKLMEGEYNLEHGIAINIDGVHLTGISGATILVVNKDYRGNPYNDNRLPVIDTRDGYEDRDVKVKISNLTIEGNNTIYDIISYFAYGSSQITNCISINSNGNAFICNDHSQLDSCISINTDAVSFICKDHSQLDSCISINSRYSGFRVYDFSKISNCTSSNSKSWGFDMLDSSMAINSISQYNFSGFKCDKNSKIIQCITKKNDKNGIYCMWGFNGIVSFNTCIGEPITDDSSNNSSGVIENNTIQEEGE